MSKKVLFGIIAILIILGIYFIWESQEMKRETTQTSTSSSTSVVANLGEHCGGNMVTARVCAVGLHCAPTPGSHLPFGDVGGTCVKD